MKSMKSSMARIMSGLTLTLATAFNATAHLPQPEPGNEYKTKQSGLLTPFRDYIMHMQRNDGGSCCNGDDAVGDLQERTKTNGTIQVRITHDLQHNKLPEPIWIDIPEKAILSARHAKEVCGAYNAANPGNNGTCRAPTMNILHFNGDVKNPIVWCYFPKPQVN